MGRKQAEDLVEIVVDGMPVPVTREEAALPDIEEIVRENRAKCRVGGDPEFAAAVCESGDAMRHR